MTFRSAKTQLPPLFSALALSLSLSCLNHFSPPYPHTLWYAQRVDYPRFNFPSRRPSQVRYKMNPDDDDRSSSTPTAASKSGSGQEKDKPRLTDQEKKNNHIASEQKRRAAIREGFDRLTELVPGLEGQGRSESIVLQKTVEFMHLKLQERQNLIAEVENKGGHVDNSLRPT
jgi:Helix-loop-helix DNA-binding domain.